MTPTASSLLSSRFLPSQFLAGRVSPTFRRIAITFLLATTFAAGCVYLAHETPARRGSLGAHVTRWPALNTASLWAQDLNQVSLEPVAPALQKEASETLAPSSPGQSCEAWLREMDGAVVPGGRDFDEEPVYIYEAGLPSWFKEIDEDLSTCDIKCKPILPDAEEAKSVARWDATTYQWPMDNPDRSRGFQVLRNMESAAYYPVLNITSARNQGYDITMTSELSSDVPLLYTGNGNFSEPGIEFEAKIPAVMAAISNCGGFTARLDILNELKEQGVDVHQYGQCGRTHNFPDGIVPPPGMSEVDAVAQKYMFYFAAENSVYPDYVTEKFFRGLLVGTIPIYLGSPTGAQFAPADGAFLRLTTIEDVPRVAEEIKRLISDRAAYEERLAWKLRGASDTFLSLVSLNNFPYAMQRCALCVHVATMLQEQALLSRVQQRHVTGSSEDYQSRKILTADSDKSRPCWRAEKFGNGDRTVFHLYVRERNTFAYIDIFIGSNNLSVAAVRGAIDEGFRAANYLPAFLRFGRQKRITEAWKVFKVYPVLVKQRSVLFEDGALNTEKDLKAHIQSVPCPRLEVILV